MTKLGCTGFSNAGRWVVRKVAGRVRGRRAAKPDQNAIKTEPQLDTIPSHSPKLRFTEDWPTLPPCPDVPSPFDEDCYRLDDCEPCFRPEPCIAMAPQESYCHCCGAGPLPAAAIYCDGCIIAQSTVSAVPLGTQAPYSSLPGFGVEMLQAPSLGVSGTATTTLPPSTRMIACPNCCCCIPVCSAVCPYCCNPVFI